MLVVSLTTIDSRLELLKKTITSLFYQTVQPDVIHVFYSNEPLFYDNGITDETIKNVNNELQLVNINKINLYFTKTENIGPYRKLIPALKIYKNDIIITIDDDHEHEQTFIEQYMYLYNKYKCIICSGGRMYDLKKFIKNELIINIPEKIPIMHIIPEGFGGILYHTSMFDEKFINFDYSKLSDNILKNDDLYFRLYTFNKNIHVVFVYILKNNLLLSQHQSLYENYNKNNNFSDTLYEINSKTNENIINSIEENINIIVQTDSYKSGTDVKILQYESFSKNRCNNVINLIQLLEKDVTNCIMINMEKDKMRYDSCIEEFKKISLKTFVHLKSTYWKEKDKLLNDMIYILDFLNIDSKVSINMFSKFSDSNIVIQDGPLACYCAHVRALIYGYLNFKEYTIIIEDDIFISNTMNIEYIKQIPDDWDIICLNASAINYNYGDEPFYKFKNTFHSTHFYIVKNRCLPIIFKNIYPIVDQIDILISRLYNELNIYNIVDTVYQKNFFTNTQNNLYVIFNSPNYQPIRNYIKEFEDLLLEHINNKLLNNHENNIIIRDCIMFDVVYNYIINTITLEKPEIKCKLLNNVPLYIKLYIIINSCVKGIHLDDVVTILLNDINFIIDCFTLHSDTNKAYRYGSTANIYKCGDFITKVYNKTLRWTHEEHDNSTEIFNKEVFILQKLNRINYVTENSFSIKYLGESLYNNFYLPSNWKEQVENIFKELTSCNIEYPEFNIKNILVLDDNISFIDFGLAKVGSNNEDNCKVFIKLLELLNNFKGEKELYSTFINNLKISGEYPNNIYI